MKKILTIFSLILLGCNNSTSPNNNKNNVVDNSVKCVSVHTLGNVVNAVVTDSNLQVARYNPLTSLYCFDKPINFPINAKVLPSTYIDVDYDNIKSANDIKPKFKELKSYVNFIDLVTDMEARAIDKNISYYKNLDINSTVYIPTIQEIKDYYKNLIEDKYNINLNYPLIDEKILNFAAYDYNLSNSLDLNADLFDSYNNLELFFSSYLDNPEIYDKVKYYSFYHSLELLDKKLIKRVDIIHKPSITYLHSSNLPIVNKFINVRDNLIAKDIKVDNNLIFIASGKDGVSRLDTNLTFLGNKKIDDTFSNSYNLDLISSDYLVVADGGEGIDIFKLLYNNFYPINKIFYKYYDESANQYVPITIDDSSGGFKQIDEVISVKSYVSPLKENMWLSFGTKNNGLYLVDLKKVLSKMDTNISTPIVYNPNDDINNTLWITGDGGSVYSQAFSSDGENLYATKDNIIEKYNLSSLLNISTPITFTIKAQKGYNLKMITKNGIDELFVSTNEGVELYDVLNNGDLEFVSEYTTEGAEDGYLPKMSFIGEKNILLFTDGYKGLKAIKYDYSNNPMLCGVGYFYPLGDVTKLAKVTSVDTYKENNEYYVIVGIDGFGVAKFKLNDLLFKHCIKE